MANTTKIEDKLERKKVKRAARRVTTSNQDEGFANAVDKFILR